MVYRDLGNTGVRLSPLGFGMMRLPADEKVVTKMVRDAIDAGVNYIDTAYPYLEAMNVLTSSATRLHRVTLHR